MCDGAGQQVLVLVQGAFPGGSDGEESACSAGMWLLSLGQENPLEKGMATHSTILAWRIPMDRGAWQAAVHGARKSQIRLSTAQQRAVGPPELLSRR